MKYERWLQLGDPPSPILFYERMSRAESRAFAGWFTETAPSRIEGLQRAIRSIPGFDSLLLDGTAGSFGGLGIWCRATIPMRWHTPEEVARRVEAYIERCRLAGIPGDHKEYAAGPRLIYIDPELAASILADIGTYIGETCRIQSPDKIAWKRDPSQYKRDVDFNAVVLHRAGNSFNPIAVPLAFFYRMMADSAGDDVFQRAYKTCREKMSLDPWPEDIKVDSEGNPRAPNSEK